MARTDKTGLFRVSCSVTTLNSEVRLLRLPAGTLFPRLGQTICRGVPASTCRGVALIGGLDASLPEMTTDVLNVATGYVVENVKRDRVESLPAPGFSWGLLVGRVLGNSHRAARP